MAAAAIAPARAAAEVDYDREANFASYKTFAWLEDAKASRRTLQTRNPLNHKRIVSAVSRGLQSRA